AALAALATRACVPPTLVALLATTTARLPVAAEAAGAAGAGHDGHVGKGEVCVERDDADAAPARLAGVARHAAAATRAAAATARAGILGRHVWGVARHCAPATPAALARGTRSAKHGDGRLVARGRDIAEPMRTDASRSSGPVRSLWIVRV